MFESSKRKLSDEASALPAVYLLVVLGVGLAYVRLALDGHPLQVSLTLLFLLLLVLTMRFRISGLLLLLILADLFLREPGQAADDNIPGGLLLAVPALLLIQLTARFRTLQRSTGQIGLRRVLQTLDKASDWQPAIRTVVRCVGQAVVCVLLAWLLLRLVPLDMSAGQNVRLQPVAFRAIRLGLLLVVVWLTMSVILHQLIWRKLSAQQARMYLRTTFLHWYHRDFRLIARRRLKTGRRMIRSENDRAAAASPQAAFIKEQLRGIRGS